LTPVQVASDDIQFNVEPQLAAKVDRPLSCVSIFAALAIASFFCAPVPLVPDYSPNFIPGSLIAISFVMLLFFCISRQLVLGVFAKISLFTLFALAFTTTCMSYTGTSMIQGSELIGTFPVFATEFFGCSSFSSFYVIPDPFFQK
jgi:hypothetical protein